MVIVADCMTIRCPEHSAHLLTQCRLLTYVSDYVSHCVTVNIYEHMTTCDISMYRVPEMCLKLQNHPTHELPVYTTPDPEISLHELTNVYIPYRRCLWNASAQEVHLLALVNSEWYI